MTELERDAIEAKKMGLSYGKYKALTYNPGAIEPAWESPINTRRRFDDRDAFRLWQEGCSDAKIAACLGVSRAIIQRWRDVMELPSTKKGPIDTSKYYLFQTKDGTYVCLSDDKKRGKESL